MIQEARRSPAVGYDPHSALDVPLALHHEHPHTPTQATHPLHLLVTGILVGHPIRAALFSYPQSPLAHPSHDWIE